MAKGIIYIMSSVVKGLLKIGKAQVHQFNNRMNDLSSNGYKNVTGLTKQYAIEVEDYDEKEKLLHNIFSKSRIDNSELFAIDLELVTQLLSSFEGKQIYPEDKTKKNVFKTATKQEAEKLASAPLYAGDEICSEDNINIFNLNNNSTVSEEGRIFYLKTKITRLNLTVQGVMEVINGRYIVKKGSICCPKHENKKTYKDIQKANIIDNILQQDVICKSTSAAAALVRGDSSNGWGYWKTKEGKLIQEYRDILDTKKKK